MKPLLVIIAFLMALPSFSQEEFLGSSSGLIVDYTMATLPQSTNVNSFGFNAFFGGGAKAGVTASLYESTSFVTLSVGSLWGNRQKKEDSYIRGMFDIAYSNIEQKSIFALTTGFIHSIHMTSDFPSSLSGVVCLQTGRVNQFEDGFRAAVDLGFRYNQAFFAHNSSYPYIGLGAALDVGEFADNLSTHLIYSFRLGLNMSFGDD